jgi:hypothetical protein
MLGLVLIYFVGKYFYELADEHGKSNWGFAILGVASYYGGIIVGGVIIAIVAELLSPGFLNEDNEIFFSILALPLGIFSCWITYNLLKRAWSKPKEANRQTLDADLIAREPERYNKEER